jgi:uncharacterized protein (DUF427 family)
METIMWKYRGDVRPDFAIEPELGQESVWDYPRPPRLEGDARLVEVRLDGQLLASTRNAIRILETASPPSFYIPREDVAMGRLVRAHGRSFCEWKGEAAYWALATDANAGVIGWSYEQPRPDSEAIRGHLSFYPARLECFVAGERVRPQPGGFYGGWLTDEIVGPVKGSPGTGHW